MAKETPVKNASANPAPVDDFENPNIGEMFGGTYPQLALGENEVSPLLTFVKNTKIQIENPDKPGEYEMRPVPVASSGNDGKLYSLPISAIFRRLWDEAKMNEGDTFKIKRYPDATKKRGRGAGNKMKNFAMKVYSRKTV